jgi:hypothetical protein
VTGDARPDRHALLELQALFSEISALRSEGDAGRFSADMRYRWVLHRLWIAAGNEALAHAQATGQPIRADRTWANLYDLRNHLAHSRLPDIDESLVRRRSGPASCLHQAQDERSEDQLHRQFHLPARNDDDVWP